MKVIGWVLSGIIGVGLAVYLIFALYEGSWSLASHNLHHSLQLQQQDANGQASIAANGWNYQTMLGQQIVSGIDNVTHDTSSIALYKQQGNTEMITNETGQRAYDAGQVCYYASQVNSALPKGDPNTNWVNKNCSGGTLSPSSIYYVK